MHTSFFSIKFKFQSSAVTLKIRSGHQTLTISSPHPKNIYVLVWSNSIFTLKRYCAQKCFSVIICGCDPENKVKVTKI